MATKLNQNAPASTGGQLDWINACKGAAIILVVFGHTWRGLSQTDLIPVDIFTTIDSRIYAFHMPVFFAISGLFITRSMAVKSAGEYVGSRIVRLIFPMIIWTYIFILVKLLAGSNTNNPAAMSDLFVLPIPGYAHLWFLWGLFILHIGYLAAKPFVIDTRLPPIGLTIVAVMTVFFATASFPGEVIKWIGSALRFSPFFALGVVFGHMIHRAGNQRWVAIFAAAVFASILVFWSAIEPNIYVRLAGRLTLTLCFLFIFHDIGASAQNVLSKTLVTLGMASMAIYLSHTIFAAGFRQALFAFGFHDVALHVVAGTFVGLVGPLILLQLARRTGTTRYLGF